MSVLKFDSQTRQSSRRGEQASAAQKAVTAKWEAEERAAVRRVASALGVTEQDVRANGARLYEHHEAILAIEEALKESAEAGRAAILAALFDYHDLGYQMGLGDGRMRVARG